MHVGWGVQVHVGWGVQVHVGVGRNVPYLLFPQSPPFLFRTPLLCTRCCPKLHLYDGFGFFFLVFSSTT